MKNSTISPVLKSLLSEDSYVCVSMIIPLHEHPSFKKMDSLVIDHAISKLKTLIDPRYHTDLVAEFIGKIRYFKDDIKRVKGVKGIGIYISEKTFHTETFNFEVTEKIVAGTKFEVRDLLYKELHLKEYLVLSLTGNEVRLFKGHADNLTEVNDENFPVPLIELEYADESPMQLENGKQSRVRKSEITESNKSFYKTLDKKLPEYLHNEQTLMVAGVEKEIASFENSSIHSNKIKGKITGSYDHYNLHDLELKAWDIQQQITKNSQTETIDSLNELFGKELVAIGIRDVWRTAMTGKGNVLVVEKDLMIPGFIGDDEFQLWLSPPKEKHRIITDSVDDVIENVLSKNGKVTFVDNGTLKEYAGIAMINRY